MDKFRVSISGREQWNELNSFVDLIEENRGKNENIALDGAKSLLESICKTILENKGVEYKKDANLNQLVKQAYKTLPVFIALSEVDQQSALRIIGSLENISLSVGEFRNNHGFFSHGNDIHSDKFDKYLLNLSIDSIVILSNFLITSHSEDHLDRSRLFYEDYKEFNEWFDEKNEWIELGGATLSPSKVLFDGDIEAYKEEIIDFENNVKHVLSKKNSLIQELQDSGNFSQTHLIISKLKNFSDFSEDQIKKIIEIGFTNSQIRWILQDSDINDFYLTVYTQGQKLFDSETRKFLDKFFIKKELPF